MTNYQIADYFTLLGKLSDIHGENSFKVKSYAAAAFNIEKIVVPLESLDQTALYATKGIGASNGKKIEELIATGTMQSLQDLIDKTPPGIIEMLQIKGLGPKKISTIWKELEIETIGELLYACNENRLLLYKGFGAKNQQSIKDSITFYLNHQGSFLWAQAKAIEPQISTLLYSIFNEDSVQLTGAFLMQNDVIDKLEYVVNQPLQLIMESLENNELFEVKETNETDKFLLFTIQNLPLSLCIYYCANVNGYKVSMEERLFQTSVHQIF